MNHRLLVLAFASVVSGCGPAIQEVRMAPATPRAEGCELEFLQLKIEDMSPMGGAYEVIGSVMLFERGVQDPFQQKYKDIVRPRACRMGGEGVTIMTQATGQGALGGSGSAVNYGVVRKRLPPGSAPAPSKF